jgi:hypothetical protein
LAAKPTALVTPQPNPVPFSGPLAPQNIVTGVISTVLGFVGLGPSMTDSPDAPAQAPLLWSLLAWVRRDIETFLSGFAGPSLAPAAVTTSLVTSPNLLVNPGAEFGDPSLSGYSSVTVPGWTVSGTPTVIEYGTQRRLPFPLATPGPTLPGIFAFPGLNSVPDGGDQFFAGGPVATSTLTQTVKLAPAAGEIDSGTVPFTLGAELGGWLFDPSAASVTVNFLDQNNLFLAQGQLAPVGLLDRLFIFTGLQQRQTTGIIPIGTRSAQVVLTLTDSDFIPGNYNNAYADNLSFTVGANLPAPGDPTPPASTVGALDHIFMVYMENKGYNDIVGSPNAPYLNSLINAYGLEANYFALAHPSLPNYYPILGGTDFGFNYNCPTNCFDETNLADKIEAAGKTWAGYAQSMPFPGAREASGDYDPSQLPFLTFSDIFNDPARAAAHLFPLTQMAVDLSSAATTPDFVWFAANEDNNGEGPIDFPFGALQFALTQITDHQYNVPALDAFLQQNVTTILNSAVWNDPTQKSAIVITFDEDNNNLSLGFGNQGNHIVTVVIPSPGAVTLGGMDSGHFVVSDYANHYSLLRTIEETLGLPGILGSDAWLTNNDRYAVPMNDFWGQSGIDD